MENKQLTDVITLAISQALNNTHTVCIAKVTAVNSKTINAKPVINRVVNGVSIELPEFIEIPPIFLQGGSSYTAHPIAIDDYCLLLINERCFDNWFNGQDFLKPLGIRTHDYSDSFAIVGINPLSSAITIPSVVTQIGDTYQEGNYTHLGDRTQTGNIILTGDYTQIGDMDITGDIELVGNINVTGNVTVSGTVAAGNFTGIGGGTLTSTSSMETTGEVTADGVALSAHTHPYTWSDGAGSGNTSAPT